jgi:putative hydrolase of the HAD superfamily
MPPERQAISRDPRPALPRAIFFDAGNTLIRMDYAAIADALGRAGATVTPETLQRAEWQARVRLDADLLAPQHRVSTESRTVADHYLKYVLEGVGVTEPATVTAIVDWRRGYNVPIGIFYDPEPAARPALELARAASVRTAVISNSNGSVRKIMESVGLADLLDFVIDSGEVGVEKPDPRIFQIALDRAGVRADEVVYVGDLYSVDVLGARAAGLEAVLLDPGGCWGERDCRSAPDVLAAVRLILSGRE